MIEAAADLAKRGGEIAALQILAAALKASPRHPQGHGLRLELLRRVGPEKDLDAWIGSLRALYERAEATPPMVLELALAEERLGDPDAALDHYQEIIALSAMRAAAPELVEYAHAGVQRCEAALRTLAAARDDEDEERRPESGGRGRPGQLRPAQPAAVKEAGPSPERAAVLTGRGSMQLPNEEAVVPVEVPLLLELAPGGSLLERLQRNDLDSLRRYRLAEEVWRWGVEHLPAVAGRAGGQPGARARGEADAAQPQLPGWLAEQVGVVVEQLRCRALLCPTNDDDAARLAVAVLERLQREGRIGRTLILAPLPLLPLWERDLRPLLAGGAPSGELLLCDSGTVENRSSELALFAPSTVVVDQAQQASSLDSRLSRTIQQLAAPRLLLLTSTPVVSDLLSLHGLVTLVRPGLLGTASAFRRVHISKAEPWLAQDGQALRQAITPAVLQLDPPAGEAVAGAGTRPATAVVPLQGRQHPPRVAAEVLELVRREPQPGVLLCRSGELAGHLREQLEREGLGGGWVVLGDEEPLPVAPLPARTAIHVELPGHPALGALRGERFVPTARQVGLLQPGGSEAL
ncbi:MAG: hypothetical protein FJ125_13125, partial [Deltaproteobacteria bacterium]|nr:hypothetical protein [Deltaproteobacteria bacterium]